MEDRGAAIDPPGMGSIGRPLADGTELTTLNGDDVGTTLNGEDAVGGGVAIRPGVPGIPKLGSGDPAGVGTTLNGEDIRDGDTRPGVPGSPKLGSGDPTGLDTTLNGDDVGTTLNGDDATGVPGTPEARDKLLKSDARAGDLGGDRGGVGRPKVGSGSPAIKGEATGSGEAKGEALRLPGATSDAENMGASPAGSRTSGVTAWIPAGVKTAATSSPGTESGSETWAGE